ncbi:hypothetical protein ACUY1T_03625 [Billgrantia sp. Q4P2]
MTPLSRQPCDACRSGTLTVAEADIRPFKPEVPEWQIVERSGIMS